MKNKQYSIHPSAESMKKFVEQDFEELEARIVATQYNLDQIFSYDPVPFLDFLRKTSGEN
jgi:hypothetical protein